MSYLKSISRLQSTPNMGGIIDILVARKADILAIPSPAGGKVYGAITMQDGKTFVQWQVILQSPKFNSNSRQTQHGDSRQNSLNFMVPKDRPDIHDMFTQASLDEFIVLYKYPDTNWKIFGLLQTPVRFEYDQSSGGPFSDRNHFSCRFYYDGPDNNFFYDGTIEIGPGGALPVIIRVNGEVVHTAYTGEIVDFTTPFAFTLQIIGTT